MGDKSISVHDLLKVPDSVIIKSQQVELGKLKSYIDELKYRKSNEEYEAALTKRNNTIKGLKENNEGLQNRVKQLMYENFNLIPHENARKELEDIFKMEGE
jgi:multidrug resistance efflux pump